MSVLNASGVISLQANVRLTPAVLRRPRKIAPQDNSEKQEIANSAQRAVFSQPRVKHLVIYAQKVRTSPKPANSNAFHVSLDTQLLLLGQRRLINAFLKVVPLDSTLMGISAHLA